MPYLCVVSAQALADNVSLNGNAILDRHVLVVLANSGLALLVHQEKVFDTHGEGMSAQRRLPRRAVFQVQEGAQFFHF